jgi:hypothetical protein
MVFRYYGVPNANPHGYYQCGIVGILAGPKDACWSDCTQCSGPAGSFFSNWNWKQTMMYMFETYPLKAESFTGKSSPRITVSLSESPLSPLAVVKEIDQQRPVISGIAPSRSEFTGTQHVALIVGSHHIGGRMILFVNDPFPYRIASNPYLTVGGRLADRNGRYEIDYDTFRRELIWVESFYGFAPR